MRNPPYFQHRRRVSVRRPGVPTACAVAGLFLVGCFFELAELDPLTGNGGVGNAGNGATAGVGVAQGGGISGGAGGAFVGPEACPPDQKRCGGSALCVSMAVSNGCGDPACEPCAQPPQASVSCNLDTDRCQVDSCARGYADCDGDLSAYTGEVAGTGCEYLFGEVRDVAQPLEVALSVGISLEDGGSRNDWAGIPAYPLEETCQGCIDETLFEITAQNEAPPKSDLDAYFRVAWDADSFYVLAEAFDRNPLDNGVTFPDGRCQTGALCEDAFSVFFDGKNDRDVSPNYSHTDDFRVFLGLGGQAFRPSGAPVSSEDVGFVAVPQGLFCYRFEAQFSWSYIVATRDPVPGSFPPEIGNEYGFDISVNDWDPAIADGKPQRQSQLFYVNPGNGYHAITTGFIPMVLSGASGGDAGP